MNTLTRPFSRIAACGFGALALILSAQAGPANGTVKPYALTLDALQDVTGKTDVTLTVSVTNGAFAAPTSATHIQLKSFDTEGELRWTKNSKNVALTAGTSSASVMQSYTDMVRFQKVDAFVQVQTRQTVNKENLTASTSVKLRPDVQVDSVTVPTTVTVNQPVNFAALLKETNGDLGATTDVKLFEGTTPLDAAAGVSVLANGSSSVVFTATFATPGTHTVTVTAGNVAPGDYDLSNNSFTLTFEVVASLQPVTFQAQYWGVIDRNYSYTWSNWYDYGHQTIQGSEESVYIQLAGIPITNGTIDKVTVDLGSDGELNAGLHFEVNNVYAYYSSVFLGQNTYLYVSPDYYGYGTGQVQVNRWAGDRVYFSQSYDYWWGNSTYTEVYHDVMLKPAATFDARIVVTSAGREYGGSLVVPVTATPYHYEWNNYDWWYYGYSYGYDNYTYVYGFTSGVTTP